ncbi:homoserine kinase [Paenibacillus sp. JX-17]|uniref:Homoserine kinase n=1 Tax=Paenibacillus lacisoli TaxID=3064525 RepID=A0ABT9CC95_9BACL|nr:homoserine kinase [Paenibacillus sp. JX-17]MDO7906871.1 homoserine kinase [Paenibacillus sp. JX-17]
MIREEGVRVRIPASTANLGPGFDTMGMALSLYAWMEMKASDQTTFHLHGDQMNGVPVDKSNLIYEVAQLVFREAGVHVPEIEVAMYSDIPLTRGLGSSASAIVGGLAAANALIGFPLPQSKLFDMATAIEKHPDNVGASLYGGIITAVWDGSRAECLKIIPDENLEVIVVIPDFQLSTSKAREVLPASLSMGDAIFNISRSTLLATALAQGRLDLIRTAMKDRLHQPYRASLVPGMAEILEHAPEHGALGAALSGAGPTVLALADRREGRSGELTRYLLETMERSGIQAAALQLLPDLEGVQLISQMQSLSFLDMIKGDVTI